MSKSRFSTCPQRLNLSGSSSVARPIPSSQQTVRLVGLGFRLWLTGYKTGDVSYWEKAWQLYCDVLGPRGARATSDELSCWVRAVRASATREIEVLPETCAGFCRDECLAVSMIAACQHKTCPAMRACAFALIESSFVEEVVDCSESFAGTLIGVNQKLSPNYIVNSAVLDDRPLAGYQQ